MQLGLPPWSPSLDDFIKLTARVLENLSPVLRQYVTGADVYVTDAPGVELIADGVDPPALALLDGIEEDDDAPVRAARLFLYAVNLSRAAGTPDAMEAEVTDAIEREISAVFLELDPAEPERHDLN